MRSVILELQEGRMAPQLQLTLARRGTIIQRRQLRWTFGFVLMTSSVVYLGIRNRGFWIGQQFLVHGQ